jgi:phosphoglycolate phosphatase-like HAD superfamily hydrolase
MFQRAWPEASTDTLYALERAFRKIYDTDGWQKTTPYPGVVETLARLKATGHVCLGVTNKPRLATQRILEQCDLQSYFREFLSPDSGEPVYKSKAEAMFVLLARYHLNPSHTLLAGDSLDDARAAQECGLRFAAFTRGYGHIRHQTGLPIDLRFESFTDLLRFIDDEGV